MSSTYIIFFFFNDTATTEIYTVSDTLSLHDALPICQPIPNLVLSNSLRAAVTGMAKTLSAELAPDRITVNCLAPDAIRTDALRRLGDLDQMERRAPMKRLAEPAEVGAACAFLCSRQAGYITGQTLGIDAD